MGLRPTYRDESALLRFIDSKRVNARLSTGWDRAPTRRLWVEGYQARSFDCELGSHFHHGYVFEGPPIMPDGRISQVRFGSLGISSVSLPCRSEVQALVRIRPAGEWFALSLVPSPASAYVGSVSDHRAADGTTKYPESLCPILALP